MHADILQLIDRQIARIFEAHVSRLITALNDAISKIQPTSKASACKSYEEFKSLTFKAIEVYCYELRHNLRGTLDEILPALSLEEADNISTLVAKYLDDDIYLSRMSIFEEAVQRHLGTFGIRHDPNECRVDLVWSLYQVHAANSMRRALAEITDDLEVRRLRNSQAPNNPPADEAEDDRFEKANKIIKLEPNIFGFGLNINNILRIFRRRK